MLIHGLIMEQKPHSANRPAGCSARQSVETDEKEMRS